MTESDSFDWSVDRVVHEFCHNPQPAWKDYHNPPRMADPATLERILRDNDVRGDTLLVEFTQKVLKEDLDIRSLGQRYDIMRAVECLRSLSTKYQLHQQATTMNWPTVSMNGGFMSPQITHSNLSSYPFSPHPLLTADPQSGYASPSRNNIPDPQNLSTPNAPQHAPQTTVLRATPAMMLQEPIQQLPERPEMQERGASSPHTAKNARDRIVEDGSLDRTAADSKKSLDRQKAVSPDAGVASASRSKSYTIVDGRKRLAPTFVSHIAKDLVSSPAAVELDQNGLGPEDVFYSDDKPDDYDEAFNLNQNQHSRGRRLYVARLMKRYLQQSTQSLANSSVVARIPYDQSYLLKPGDPRYFTMFVPGLAPAVHNLQHWPGLAASAVVRRRGRPIQKLMNVSSEDQGEATEDMAHNEGDYDYLLEKYPAQDENEDTGFALYGESGDEGEYDIETWNEIEQDRRDAEQENLNDVMSKVQVEIAIDEAIEDIKSQWYEKKLAKTQIKAYRLWMKTRNSRQCQSEIDNCHYWMNRFDQTIRRMRDTIMKDTWHKSAEVKQQCKIFDEAVPQREEYLHFVKVLSESAAPPKPNMKAYKAKGRAPRPELPDGEELLESDSDDLGDFILDDSAADDDSSDAASIPHDAEFTDAMEFQGIEEPTGVTNFMDSILEAEIPETTPEPETRVPIIDEDHRMDNAEEPDIVTDDESDDMGISTARKAETSRRLSSTPRKGVEKLNRSYQESDNEGLAQDSDLDAPPRLPRSKYSTVGRSKVAPVDLTLSSSPSGGAAERTEESSTDFDVHTPELNPIKGTPVKQKLTLNGPRTLDIPQDSPSPVRTVKFKQLSLPMLDDVRGIKGVPWEVLEDRCDLKRILARAVYCLPKNDATKLQSYIHGLRGNISSAEIYSGSRETSWGGNSEKKFGDQIRAGLIAIRNKQGVIPDTRPNIQRAVRLSSQLYTTYACHTNLMDEGQIAVSQLDQAYDDLQYLLQSFSLCLLQVLTHYLKGVVHRGTKRKASDEDEDYQETQEADVELVLLDSDMDNDASDELQEEETGGTVSHKKRKRKVEQSQEALSQQRSDQLRILEDERRKALVESRYADMGISGDDPAGHIVGYGEPNIYLHEHIGKRVKPHQVEGIQFMWREIITDPKQQGCILAHTMGLGKTMQVISLLLTIALAAKSEATRDQIPERLRERRILILCPPSLIDNWHDELLMWSPNLQVLGGLFKITAGIGLLVKLRDLHEWATKGGVVIISYEMFRSLILNPKGRLNEEQHEQVQADLLDSPGIIIADEAHKMKNAGSKVTQIAQRFRSTSRIALTGSPLANNLEEYHTMVDWIAPGYLGTMVQFKAKYTEPISAGLYEDSTSGEKRLSLRKLRTLGRDLEPKLHRMDITAIEKDMPPKTEFFITLPLTKPQIRAYNIYVEYLLNKNDPKSPGNAKLWQWLHVLGLLCNHPSAFVHKLEERQHTAGAQLSPSKKKGMAGTDESQGDALPTDVVLADVGLSEDMIEKALHPFRKMDDDNTLEEPNHSNRALLVKEIVEECMDVGDKVLIFSHTLPTLNYLDTMLEAIGCKTCRIDGETKMSTRQDMTKGFNKKESKYQVFLISMKAGGLGLNLQGANRVIIYDFGFNPTWEEQAIGRAYRLGQRKPVYVYRFRAGGTFEDVTYNKAVFKTTLFSRVVDKKNYMSQAKKSISSYLFPVRDVEQQDLEDSIGRDPKVLDLIAGRNRCIRNIELTETFQKEDVLELTEEEAKQAEEELEDQRLERDNPQAFARKQAMKAAAQRQSLNPTMVSRRFPSSMASPGRNSNVNGNWSGITSYQSSISNGMANGSYHASSMSGAPTTYFDAQQASVFGLRAPVHETAPAHPIYRELVADGFHPAAAYDVQRPPLRSSSSGPERIVQTDGADDEPTNVKDGQEPPDDCKTQ